MAEMGKFIRNSFKNALPKPRVLFGINTGKSFEFVSGPDTLISGNLTEKPLKDIFHLNFIIKSLK